DDLVERARLLAERGFDAVAVHGIAGPYDLRAFALHAPDELRKTGHHLVGAETRDEDDAPRDVLGIEDAQQPEQIVLGERGTALDADGILDAATEFDMRPVGIARAVADPDHMTAGRVVLPGDGVFAGERLLI